jgi:adenylate kinase
MRISLLGLPGAGKSTLGQLISNMFNCMYVSSGALARAHGFAGSESEKMGLLDPDEEKIRGLVHDVLKGSNHYILDGFPRTIDQVEQVHTPIDYVLYLKLSDFNIGIQRLLHRGRPDDKLEVIEMRLFTYATYTMPLTDYFEHKKKLLTIDADGTIAETLGLAVNALAGHGVIEAKEYVSDIRKQIRKDQQASNSGEE